MPWVGSLITGHNKHCSGMSPGKYVLTFLAFATQVASASCPSPLNPHPPHVNRTLILLPHKPLHSCVTTQSNNSPLTINQIMNAEKQRERPYGSEVSCPGIYFSPGQAWNLKTLKSEICTAVEPRFNKPLFNENHNKTNNILCPSNSKIYEK